jgi:acyl carrier protein
MEESSLRAKITETFRDVLGDPKLELKDELTAQEVEGWDSISHINLIVALETRFKVKLTTGEVSKLKNVGDLVALLKRKTA